MKKSLMLVFLSLVLLSGCGDDNPTLGNTTKVVGKVNGKNLYRLSVSSDAIINSHYIYYFEDDNQPLSINYDVKPTFGGCVTIFPAKGDKK